MLSPDKHLAFIFLSVILAFLKVIQYVILWPCAPVESEYYSVILQIILMLGADFYALKNNNR